MEKRSQGGKRTRAGVSRAMSWGPRLELARGPGAARVPGGRLASPPPAATWAAPSGSARDPEGLGPGRFARGHLCQRDVTMRQCPLWRGPRGPPYFITLLSKSYRAAFSKCFAH